MSDGAATAVSLYHLAGDRSAFPGWAERLDAAARLLPGYRDGQISVTDGPGDRRSVVAPVDVGHSGDDHRNDAAFDDATAVTFDDAATLHDWLDSPARSQLLAEGAALGIFRKSSDVLIVNGESLANGVGIYRHSVAPGKEPDFIATQRRFVTLSGEFSGFEGTALLRPPHPGGEWLSVQRFRSDGQLDAWLSSPTRLAALPQLRSNLSRDFTVITRRTPFGSILRVQDGTTRVTPRWKTAMLVLFVLYPTVMTLSRFLGPVLDRLGAEPWLSMWLSQIVSVGLMTFLLMPVVTGWFRRWLDPVDGAGRRVSLAGAAVVAAGYALTLTIFASVTWLQFWQHPN